MSRRLESHSATLTDAAWPSSRVAEAIQALARHAGLPVAASEPISLSADLPIEQMNDWIERAADQTGVQAEQAFIALDEIDVLLSTGGPVLVRLSALEGAPFLAVVGCRGRFVPTLGPDFRVHQVLTQAVVATIRRPFEASVESDVEPVVERLQ